MTFEDAKQRFSNRVADYARYRPSYPSELVQLLREECGLRPEHVVADIGSGTGLLTQTFSRLRQSRVWRGTQSRNARCGRSVPATICRISKA